MQLVDVPVRPAQIETQMERFPDQSHGLATRTNAESSRSPRKEAGALLRMRAGRQTAKLQRSVILEYLPCPRPCGQVEFTLGGHRAAIGDLSKQLGAPVVFAATLIGAGTGT